ncbi:phage portal protein [Aeromonas lacus]
MFSPQYKSVDMQAEHRAYMADLMSAQVPLTPIQRQITVQSCVRILAETIGKLPARIQRSNRFGKELIHKHKMLDVLTRYPNDYQTMQEFLEMVVTHLCLDGNFYAFIVRAEDKADSNIISLIPVEVPNAVSPVLVQGKLIYRITPNPNILTDGRQEYTADEILHIKLPNGRLLKGESIISRARSSIDTALSQEAYASVQSKTGCATVGFFNLKPEDSNIEPEAFDELADTLGELTKGPSTAGSVPLLPGPVEFQSISLSAKDAQFLESRQFQRSEICGMFRVPENFLNGNASLKYNNVEQTMLSFYTETISPYITRIQSAINRHLSMYGIEFSLDESELKRGDSSTMYKNAMEAYGAGLITLNEARDIIGFTGADDYDIFKLQANNERLGTIEQQLEYQDALLKAQVQPEPQEQETNPENNNNNEGINNEDGEEELPLQSE